MMIFGSATRPVHSSAQTHKSTLLTVKTIMMAKSYLFAGLFMGYATAQVGTTYTASFTLYGSGMLQSFFSFACLICQQRMAARIVIQSRQHADFTHILATQLLCLKICSVWVPDKDGALRAKPVSM
jgi:hypothetical protein